MTLKLITQPVTEPVSLVDMKMHLRVDSGSLADNLTSVQSIAPGSHNIAAAWSLVGVSVDILGYTTVVEFESGTNGTGGTVDVKLQESDDNATWTDVANGAFTQVTETNDNATYEIGYTGLKHYLRVVSTVAVVACSFSVSIIKNAPVSAEDTLISSLITAARQYCESVQNRQFVTATWELWLDYWPGLPMPWYNNGPMPVNNYVYQTYNPNINCIEIPIYPVISVGSIKYYDTANTEYTFDAANYFVDIKGEPARVTLNYGKYWPNLSLRPINGICVTFTAGYTGTDLIPESVKAAIKLLVGHFYEHREAVSDKPLTAVPLAVDSLLGIDRVIPI